MAVYLEGRLQPEVGELLKNPILALVLLFVVLAAFGINAVARYRLLSPLAISIRLQLPSERRIAAATCSAVTIEVGERNQAVPRIPSRPASKWRS
jgi:hypothetical protein